MSRDRFVLNGPTNFMLVANMNNAFNNPKGFSNAINYDRIAKQMLNVADELAEVFKALGADEASVKLAAHIFKSKLEELRKEGTGNVDLDGLRDGISDIHVFSYGAHHLMGIDADRDLASVITGVMTRFIKDEADHKATVAKHAALGVTQVYFEGEYPTMVMKSAVDQPDAPKGKFLKSASYTEPVFYSIE